MITFSGDTGETAFDDDEKNRFVTKRHFPGRDLNDLTRDRRCLALHVRTGRPTDHRRLIVTLNRFRCSGRSCLIRVAGSPDTPMESPGECRRSVCGDEMIRREQRACVWVSLNRFFLTIAFCFVLISEEKEVNGHDEPGEETKVSDCDTKNEDVAADVVTDSPPVEFTIIHNKDKYVVSMPLSSTIGQLKDKLVDMIGVPSKMQKIMIKGLAKDDQTLESLNVSSSSKIMVVGAKLQDIVAVSVANVEEVCETIVIVLSLL